MTVSGVMALLLLQTTVVFAGGALWYGYRDRVKKLMFHTVVDETLSTFEAHNEKERADFKTVCMQTWGMSDEQASAYVKQSYEKKAEQMLGMIQAYYDAEPSCLTEYASKSNALFASLMSLKPAVPTLGDEDLVLDTGMTEKYATLLTLSNELLKAHPAAGALGVDAQTSYTLEQLQQFAATINPALQKTGATPLHVTEMIDDSAAMLGLDLDTDLNMDP